MNSKYTYWPCCSCFISYDLPVVVIIVMSIIKIVDGICIAKIKQSLEILMLFRFLECCSYFDQYIKYNKSIMIIVLGGILNLKVVLCV